MKKIISALTAAAFTAATFVLPAMVPAAHAQIATGIGCEAHSPYAFGVWVAPDGNYACQRALSECAARSPYGSVCVVTRWWYVY
jgi:hypothetical protein